MDEKQKKQLEADITALLKKKSVIDNDLSIASAQTIKMAEELKVTKRDNARLVLENANLKSANDGLIKVQSERQKVLDNLDSRIDSEVLVRLRDLQDKSNNLDKEIAEKNVVKDNIDKVISEAKLQASTTIANANAKAIGIIEKSNYSIFESDKKTVEATQLLDVANKRIAEANYLEAKVNDSKKSLESQMVKFFDEVKTIESKKADCDKRLIELYDMEAFVKSEKSEILSEKALVLKLKSDNDLSISVLKNQTDNANIAIEKLKEQQKINAKEFVKINSERADIQDKQEEIANERMRLEKLRIKFNNSSIK